MRFVQEINAVNNKKNNSKIFVFKIKTLKRENCEAHMEKKIRKVLYLL